MRENARQGPWKEGHHRAEEVGRPGPDGNQRVHVGRQMTGIAKGIWKNLRPE